ncbi:MAG TPA: alpha-2-macroglobulin, partial [Nannocystaceae bacterium]|nr:alpha-2-macroglobulin [Nannocystaceae bacterium]
PRVEKLTRGLTQLRGEGRIANTQERAYALLAFAEYARRKEPDAADLAADVWIGPRALPGVELRGRSAPAVERRSRLVAPRRGEVGRVTVRREGSGRLYWRVGMTWTPKDAGKRPSAHGITVDRSLRTRAGDVGEAEIPAGELVALDVAISVDVATRYVAVDLPLPPGLEAVDDTIGAGRRARVLAGGRASWVSHQELRRDRAVVFADALGPGLHRTTVFLRATTPGRFAMPPAVAHAMYMPEIRGHTAEARVVVAPPK